MKKLIERRFKYTIIIGFSIALLGLAQGCKKVNTDVKIPIIPPPQPTPSPQPTPEPEPVKAIAQCGDVPWTLTSTDPNPPVANNDSSSASSIVNNLIFPLEVSSINNGFSFTSLNTKNPLLTGLEIDFSSVDDQDGIFTVFAESVEVGQFSSGDIIDFGSFPNKGVSEISIVGLDSLNQSISGGIIDKVENVCTNIEIVSTSEPTFPLSLIALGTLGGVSALKRKLKPSKSTEKETTKVS